MQSDTKPINMTRWLIKNKKLNGLTREQIIFKLGDSGETEFNLNENDIYYKVNHTYTVLVIHSEDNKVKRAYIYILTERSLTQPLTVSL
jgi:hypothetical protein